MQNYAVRNLNGELAERQFVPVDVRQHPTKRPILKKDANGQLSYKIADGFNSEDIDEELTIFREAEEARATLMADNKTDDEKKAARDLLKNYFGAMFDGDLETRNNEVVKLEERVAKLRAQIEKRKETKDKIIEARMTLIENDGAGLAMTNVVGPMYPPNALLPSSGGSPYPTMSPMRPSVRYQVSPDRPQANQPNTLPQPLPMLTPEASGTSR